MKEVPGLTVNQGNCLFHAFSDQLTGHPDQHAEIRARTVTYIKEHPDDFKPFVGVFRGGGTRRNPKRKVAGSAQAKADARPASAEEVDAAFQRRINDMSNGGTWGDNIEIVAFAKAYSVNVEIYSTAINRFLVVKAPRIEGKSLPVLHIVHHVSLMYLVI